jgi:aminotransferase
VPKTSRMIQTVDQALSIAVNNRIYEMQAAGKDVTILSLGEAFFDIPLFGLEGLAYPGLYHYSHSRGTEEFRSLVAGHYLERLGTSVDPASEVLVTPGSKAAIYFAMKALLDPGDQVLMQEPTWLSYPEQARLCLAEPVCMPYYATLEDYERYAGERCRMIIVTNPHNPRGYVMAESELAWLLDLARERDIWVLADEAYSDFVVDGSFVSLGRMDPDKENIVVCNSLSKTLGISGWRLGYAIAAPEVIDEMLKVQQHVTTCPATVLEHYVVAHYREILDAVRPQIEELAVKRAKVADLLDRLDLGYLPGTATFYFFVSIAPSRLGSVDFASRLLEESSVGVVPGIGYGASCDGFIRVSVGTEPLERIAAALQSIKRLVADTSDSP